MKKESSVKSDLGIPSDTTTNSNPEFIRLPKAGKLCPYTSLSRSKLNQLILPNKENNFKPQVKSVSLRKKGMQKGTRLIVWESLYEYLLAHIEG